MSKIIRIVIFVTCLIMFFSMTPFIIGYSLGYRIDLDQHKIVATGGIYLRVWPSPAEIFIDSKPGVQTSIVTNSSFTQNLLPKDHIVLVKKEGYFDYQKTLSVKEKEATKLEHITLFKQNILFQKLDESKQSPFDQKDRFLIKNGNIYDNSKEKPVLIIKNVIAFDTHRNNIFWISKDGLLYVSDFSGKNQNQVFESFYAPVKDIKISPDGQKIFYYNDYEMLYSYLPGHPSNKETFNKIFLNRFSEKISDCIWINNDYIAFTISGKIKISEIDNNNEINIIELPQNMSVADSDIKIKNPKIYFGTEDKKLYILTQGTVLISEQITQ